MVYRTVNALFSIHIALLLFFLFGSRYIKTHKYIKLFYIVLFAGGILHFILNGKVLRASQNAIEFGELVLGV
jgi:hypothetical protein